ncbi:MAG: DUF6326 family protein [Candidatus Thorarchaeota archaeon]|jgi:uncharacterized membrane protein HdeD (DUF308 family)
MEDVKIKLSALWVAAMFCYLYADVLAYMAPGHLAEILTGEIAGIPIDDLFLVAGAMFMVPPIVMIFLSVFLKTKTNRWLNIIVGIVYTLVGVGMVFMASNAGYVVYGIVESVVTALIVLVAWMWPKQED